MVKVPLMALDDFFWSDNYFTGGERITINLRMKKNYTWSVNSTSTRLIPNFQIQLEQNHQSSVITYEYDLPEDELSRLKAIPKMVYAEEYKIIKDRDPLPINYPTALSGFTLNPANEKTFVIPFHDTVPTQILFYFKADQNQFFSSTYNSQIHSATNNYNTNTLIPMPYAITSLYITTGPELIWNTKEISQTNNQLANVCGATSNEYFKLLQDMMNENNQNEIRFEDNNLFTGKLKGINLSPRQKTMSTEYASQLLLKTTYKDGTLMENASMLYVDLYYRTVKVITIDDNTATVIAQTPVLPIKDLVKRKIENYTTLFTKFNKKLKNE